MSRTSLIAPGLAVALSLLLPGPASARDDGHAPRVLTLQQPIEREVIGNYMSVPGIEPGILTEGFLSSHPDMRWRPEGLYSYNRAEYDIPMDPDRNSAETGKDVSIRVTTGGRRI